MMRVVSLLLAALLAWSGSALAQTPNLSGYLQNAATSNVNGSSLAIGGYTQTMIQVSGTMGGATVTPQGSLDNSNFNTLTCFDTAGTVFSSGFTATGLYRCNTIAVQVIRAPITGAGGATSVTAVASAVFTNGPIKDNPFSGSGNQFTSPQITTGLNDANGNGMLLFSPTTSAVNDFTVTNAASGNSPILSVTGTGTNIDLNLTTKGTGAVIANASQIKSKIGTGNAPTCSTNCGTSPSITGSNSVMRITLGSTAPSSPITVTFGDSYTNYATCVAQTDSGSSVVSKTITQATVAQINFSTGPFAKDIINLICFGNS